MADLARVNASWQNWPGAPGTTTMFFDPGSMQTMVDAMRAFFQALVTLLPTGLKITVPAAGDVINDTTGNLVGAWTAATPPADVTGTSAAAYPGPAGAMVHWLTGGFLDGRRVRGRTFIVPITASFFDTNGTLGASTVTTIQNAANTFLTTVGTQFHIWHRPFAGDATHPAHIGGSATVTSARVPDLTVTLRTRRQ